MNEWKRKQRWERRRVLCERRPRSLAFATHTLWCSILCVRVPFAITISNDLTVYSNVSSPSSYRILRILRSAFLSLCFETIFKHVTSSWIGIEFFRRFFQVIFFPPSIISWCPQLKSSRLRAMQDGRRMAKTLVCNWIYIAAKMSYLLVLATTALQPKLNSIRCPFVDASAIVCAKQSRMHLSSTFVTFYWRCCWLLCKCFISFFLLL